MADNARQAFVAAEDALRAGKYEEALAGYLGVVRAVPTFWRARFRIADTLLNFKAPRAAYDIYNALAWHAIKAGQPLEGLVAIKMAALMDKTAAGAIDILAQLYSRESERVDPDSGLLRRPKPTDKDPVTDHGLTGQQLLQAAAKEAAATDGIADYPDKLPSIPLFSFLDEDAFAAVLAGLQLKRFVKGQHIIVEGQPGDSFFILAEGNVEVTRKSGDRVVPLARLHAGAVFGEMALISRAPRTATVTATNDCDLLELKREALEDQAHQLQSVTRALHDFTQDRFLTNLTATSPIFKPFPRSIRTEIIKRFQDFPVEPGDVLIEEGEAGQGLYMILKGKVEVTKKGDGGEPVSLATLKEGDVFGEISLIQSSPTTASCSAVGKGNLLFLPKHDFSSLVARHPEMKEELSKMTAERLKKTEEALMPEADDFVLIEDDDLIML